LDIYFCMIIFPIFYIQRLPLPSNPHSIRTIFLFFIACLIAVIYFKKMHWCKGNYGTCGSVCFNNAQPCVEVPITTKYSLMNIWLKGFCIFFFKYSWHMEVKVLLFTLKTIPLDLTNMHKKTRPLHWSLFLGHEMVWQATGSWGGKYWRALKNSQHVKAW